MRAFLSFLGQIYERLLAVVVLLFLVLCMGWLVLRVNNLKTEIKVDVETVPKGADAAPADLRAIKETRERLAAPPNWAENPTNRLFIAPLMKVIPPSEFPKRVDRLQDAEMKTPEGFPIRWLRQYGLPADRPVALEDADNDGFTVREEFEAGTNPTDPSSRPDISRKLRVESILQRPFPFLFKGIIEGSARKFNVQRADGSVAHFVEMGGAVLDKTDPGYRVTNYAEKIEERRDAKNRVTRVDVSELTLERAGEKPIVLVRNRPAASGDLSARLYFILEDRSFLVSPGAEFTLQGTVYQVISIKTLDRGGASVIIRRKDTPGEIPVIPLEPGDLKRVPGFSADPAGFSPPPPPP